MEIASKRKVGTLKIYINPESNQKLRVIAVDKQKTASVYLDSTFEVVARQKEIEIPFPLSPNKMLIKFESEQKIPLDGIEYVTQIKVIPKQFSKELYDFIDNVLSFSESASYSKLGLYADLKLDYADHVRDSTKKIIDTPARTHVQTGKITVSKALFKTFTIPQRVFTLLHERGHYEYREKYDPNSEQAKREHEKLADDFAIDMYMSLGFPEEEANNVMAKIIPNESYRDGRDQLIDFHTNTLNKLRNLKKYRNTWQKP